MMDLPTKPYRRSRAKRILGAILLAVSVLNAFGLAILIAYGTGRRQSEREHRENSVTLRKLLVDLEDIRTRLGRVPTDEAELIALRGKPMPKAYDQGALYPVDYLRTTDTTYRLHYESWATDDWTYDSTKPHEGWVQSFY
ncbi:MAG: hypothetical protein ACJ8C4_13815 [Gemmataceae bacterium]